MHMQQYYRAECSSNVLACIASNSTRCNVQWFPALLPIVNKFIVILCTLKGKKACICTNEENTRSNVYYYTILVYA